MIVTKCVHAYSSSWTNLPCNSAWHTLPMDTEVVDSHGYHDNASNNSRITFPSGGPHLVFGAPQWFDPGFTVYSRLAKNGTSVGYEYGVDGFAALPTQYAGTTPFWLENFAPGDYMEVQTWNNRNAAGGGSNFRDARGQMCAIGISDWSCMIGSQTASAASPQTYGTTIYDPHGMATSSTTITIQKAGFYLVLGMYDANTVAQIYCNGVILNGSYTQGAGPCDYAIGRLNVGDTLQVISGGSMGHRQFAAIWLGGNTASLAYTYLDYNLSNTDAHFSGYIRSNVEWFDTGNGHPKGGFVYDIPSGKCTSCGKYNLLEGYHFALSKISTDGGTFVQNDSTYHILNGSQLGLRVSTNRHERPSRATTLAFSAFAAVEGDEFAAMWQSSAIYVEGLFTPWSNVFLTDPGPVFTPQIYRWVR